MRGGRLLSVFLAAAIFLLQGGDCVSLFFADQQAHDCCHKGHCSPSNPDPCCQLNSKTTVTQAPVLGPVALGVIPTWTHSALSLSVDPQLNYRMTVAPSPPGQLGNFSTPLLV